MKYAINAITHGALTLNNLTELEWRALIFPWKRPALQNTNTLRAGMCWRVKSQIFSSVSGILVFDFVPEAQKSSGFYKRILTSLRFYEEQI